MGPESQELTGGGWREASLIRETKQTPQQPALTNSSGEQLLAVLLPGLALAENMSLKGANYKGKSKQY